MQTIKPIPTRSRTAMLIFYNTNTRKHTNARGMSNDNRIKI
jgi:hypothetical protein